MSRLGNEIFLEGVTPTDTYMPSGDILTPLVATRRKAVGKWYGNKLHELWCSKPFCFKPQPNCTCRLCGTTNISPQHLSKCAWFIGSGCDPSSPTVKEIYVIVSLLEHRNH
jgi:hypothetical protein